MSEADDIEVQALVAARVHIVKSRPGSLVLQVTGARDETYFLMTVEELTALAGRLTADAQLLSTTSETGASPS